MVMRCFVVIAYDIRNDRRRNRISDILEKYGKRVNYSVFECLLNGKDLIELKMQIGKIVQKKSDRVLYYYLCRDCAPKTERFGCFHDIPAVVESA